VQPAFQENPVMMHRIRFVVLILIASLAATMVSAQDTTDVPRGTEVPGNEVDDFHPSLSFDISSDARWRSGDGFAMEQGRLWTALRITPEISLLGLVRSPLDTSLNWYDFGRRRYNVAQLYAQYRNTLSISDIDVDYTARAGKLEWFPSFTEPRLVIEHIDEYLNPTSFYGVNLSAGAMLYEPFRISAYAEGFSGDLIDQNVKPQLTEAVLRAEPQLIGDLGIRAQVGKSPASIHAVNYAYLNFRPTFLEYLTLDLRGGKLAALDQTPYGVHVGLIGTFEYIELGGYYERRIDQEPGTQILGFYYRIIGPPLLARILGTYQVLYDFNTNTLRFTIPFIAVNFNW
jgi:hypothetical protein